MKYRLGHLALALFLLSVVFLAYVYLIYPLGGVDRLVVAIGGTSLVIHFLWMLVDAIKRPLKKKGLWILAMVMTFFVGSYGYYLFVFRRSSSISN